MTDVKHTHATGGHAGPPGTAATAPAGRELTRLAVSATLHCLTGCAAGEVLGMVLATWWGWGDAASVALAVGLAFVLGYATTVVPLLRSGLDLRRALRIALAADTVSLVTMETIDNVLMLTIPGAMDAGLASWVFWGSLAFSLAVAFVLTVPVNRFLIARGKGHAVVPHHH
ncbi:DUF4396 domain-containing protein [Kineococcus sp. NUM-3379]